MDAVLAFSDDALARVIRQCTLCDGGVAEPGGDDDVTHQLRDALHLPTDICKDTVRDALAGWLKGVVMDCWRRGREAWVTHEAFTDRTFHLVFKLRRDRVRERPAHQILVTAARRKRALVKRFVEHLADVRAPEEVVTDAVNDFLRFSTEYSRLLAEGEVDATDWRAFFDELRDRWKPIFRRAVLNGGSQSPEVVGQDVLHATTGSDFRGILAGQKTTYQYLTSGGYHRLADGDLVWWHPRFRQEKHTKG